MYVEEYGLVCLVDMQLLPSPAISYTVYAVICIVTSTFTDYLVNYCSANI